MAWHRGGKGAWQDLVYRASQAQGDLGETQLGFARLERSDTLGGSQILLLVYNAEPMTSWPL